MYYVYLRKKLLNIEESNNTFFFYVDKASFLSSCRELRLDAAVWTYFFRDWNEKKNDYMKISANSKQSDNYLTFGYSRTFFSEFTWIMFQIYLNKK